MARQDPVKVDPMHYTVEVENRQVRVLRIRYGAREKSVMHGHPASIGVHLTDAHARFTFPDGKTEELRVTAGEVRSYPAGDHLPENLSDRPFELVLVEPKGAGGSEEASFEEAGTAAVKETVRRVVGSLDQPVLGRWRASATRPKSPTYRVGIHLFSFYIDNPPLPSLGSLAKARIQSRR